MSMQPGSIDADGLARTTDGKLYVTLGSGSAIDSPTFTGIHIGDAYPIAQSFTSVSAPADTSEDTLATITVPANALGNNGAVRVKAFFSYTNNANNKTLKIHVGGGAGQAYVNSVRTTNVSSLFELMVGNQGATNSQQGSAVENTGAGGSAVLSNTSSVDTTASWTIVITGQKATAGDTLTLNWYTAEVVRTTV